MGDNQSREIEYLKKAFKLSRNAQAIVSNLTNICIKRIRDLIDRKIDPENTEKIVKTCSEVYAELTTIYEELKISNPPKSLEKAHNNYGKAIECYKNSVYNLQQYFLTGELHYSEISEKYRKKGLNYLKKATWDSFL